MNLIRKLDDLLSRIAKTITACVLFFQVIIIFLGVVYRYFLNSPLTWVDELACYLLVFVTFVGGYVALKENKLARISFVVEKFPPLARRILVILADLAVLVFMVVLVYNAVKLAGMPVILNQRTPSMRIPMIVFFSFIPFASILMCLTMIVKTYDAFRGDYEIEGEEEQVV